MEENYVLDQFVVLSPRYYYNFTLESISAVESRSQLISPTKKGEQTSDSLIRLRLVGQKIPGILFRDKDREPKIA